MGIDEYKMKNLRLRARMKGIQRAVEAQNTNSHAVLQAVLRK